jgi:thiol:disulfide interchange protein DsbD
MTIVFALACPPLRGATTAPADLVKADLISDVRSIEPGKDFAIGILLKIKPGWHVYWKNPGESGAPPRVTWHLPDGFNATDLHFPIPRRFDQEGGVTAFGYEDEVLLVSVITPPKDVRDNQRYEFSADAWWLVCEKMCIPGQAKIKLGLPGGDGRKAHAEFWETWWRRFPAPVELAKHVVKSTGYAATDGAAFVEWALDPPADVHWFPAPPADTAVQDERVTATENRSTYSFSLVPKPKAASTMQFLVTFKGFDGKQSGVEFTVNVPPVVKQ